jgi:predicted component of type VI protein secretion system
MNWIKKFFRHIFSRHHQSTQDWRRSVLEMVQSTDDVELSCDEVLVLLAEYTEREQRGEDVRQLMPLVAAHLERCRDCLEEYQALHRILDAPLGA